MFAGVVSDVEQFKIFNAVVSPLTVSVVNVLGSEQRTPKMPFHDKAMFQYVDPRSCDLNVSIPPHDST